MAHRLRRITAVAALTTPLVVAPVVAPAALADSPFGYGSTLHGGRWGTPSYTAPSTATGSSTTTEPATAAESTGVVLIDTVVDYGQARAAGTGLVLDSDGIVVTNHHVVEGSTSITVTDPSTGTTYDATVLGYDATADIAVLRLAGASGLATVDTDTGPLVYGDDVTAVGNAEGGGTLIAADGDVTATEQSITVSDDSGSGDGYESLSDLIEIDASIVPGDSGGALLDSDGEVIGMNVAASSGGYTTVGYAIPVGTVLEITAEILQHEVSADLTFGYDAALGIGVVDTGAGVEVAGVVDGGAADTAGIAAGSTITAIGGVPVTGLSDLTGFLASHEPGESVRVTWTDAAGATHRATAVLGRAPLD